MLNVVNLFRTVLASRVIERSTRSKKCMGMKSIIVFKGVDLDLNFFLRSDERKSEGQDGRTARRGLKMISVFFQLNIKIFSNASLKLSYFRVFSNG